MEEPMGESNAYVIFEPDLQAWVQGLLRRAEVIAPRAAYGSDVTYDVVTSPAEVAWDYSTSVTPLKRFLFPQHDSLFRWESNGGDLTLAPTYDETERVFLAVRPCDVSGVRFLDRVFSRDREDVYYLARRQRSTLIALACTEPGPNCFCVCAHAGPFLEDGYDLQLTHLPPYYLAEVGSAKGARLVRDAGLFSEAPAEVIRARQEEAEAVRERFGEDTAYFAAALRKVTFNRVPDELWEQLGARCLGCGGCAFVCPTCTCFTTADANGGAGGERDRLWDSCLYEAYTLEASGHNPRGERKHRVKARFFHKLSYQFTLRAETHGCVGCGRCITACLGGNDMPTVTAGIRQGAL
jgi:sulfhydrogenase subunit beta (sulfur reductase)